MAMKIVQSFNVRLSFAQDYVIVGVLNVDLARQKENIIVILFEDKINILHSLIDSFELLIWIYVPVFAKICQIERNKI